MQVIKTREELNEKIGAIKASGNKYAIYGMGNMARTLVRYIVNQEGMLRPERCIVAGRMPKVHRDLKGVKLGRLRSVSALKKNGMIIIAANGVPADKALERLEKARFNNVFVLDYDLFLQMSWEENVPMGFLSPGFAKCATSALNTALKKNKKIFLSKQKETNYMHWRPNVDDAPERFREMYYFNYKEGQVLGNFEPSYHKRSKDIYECFGPDLKLIFMMRNPASATYSYFKMMMRRTKFKRQVLYYLRHRHFCMDMFEDYLRDYVYTDFEDRFHYDRYIEKFLEYWPKENMKFVFFEDLIRDPESVMNEVQDFIGVDRVKIDKLPSANIGSEVAKNFAGAVLNWFSYVLERRVKAIPSKKIKKRFVDFRANLYKHTMIENSEKISDEMKAELIDYYMDSIKRVEEISGRDLKGVWY